MKFIELNVKTRKVDLTRNDQSLASLAAARKTLVPEFINSMDKKRPTETRTTLIISPATLRLMVSKYSEQLIYQPLREIEFWFGYKSGAFIEPGYPPLYYGRTKGKIVSPNKSAIAAIGEGVAGLIGQRLYGARKLARPNHDFPDIVMKAGPNLFLVESKASVFERISSAPEAIYNEFPRMASYASTCKQIDTRNVVGILVATSIVSEAEYEVIILEINLL